jgi:hypothetical protein
MNFEPLDKSRLFPIVKGDRTGLVAMSESEKFRIFNEGIELSEPLYLKKGDFCL